MKFQYYVVDAFAENVFEGSPTGIVIIEGEWPDDKILTNITIENAFPETAFIRKEKDGYYIRWFAPTGEIDLCGHATLASAYVIKEFLEPDLPKVSFASQSGDLEVGFTEDGLLEMNLPSRMPEPTELTDELIAALGGVVPVESYKSRDYFFLLKDEEELINLKPDFNAMAQLEYGDGVIVTAAGTKTDIATRAFFPKLLTDEDYVCGSAHCNLIPFWEKRLNKTKMVSRQYSSRGAVVYCESCGDRVKVAGKVSFYCKAEININL